MSRLDTLSTELKDEVLAPVRAEVESWSRALSASQDQPLAFADLNERRLFVSQSLLAQGEARQRWDAANFFIADYLRQDKPLNASALTAMNEVLTGSSKGFRDHAAFAGTFAFPPAEEIVEAMRQFDQKLSEFIGDPLVKAAIAYIWICNVHPFEDGNGRTARLFADAVLIDSGYLPLAFPLAADAHVVFGYAGREFTLEEAIIKTWRALIHSYRVVLNALS